jgi:hypothetical protein
MSGLSISLLDKFSVSRENQVLGGIHARDFYEKGENAPELYLMVEDAAGNELFSSRENVRPQAGQSEYFVIQSGKATTNAATKKRGRPSKAAAAKTVSASSVKTIKKVKTAGTLRKKNK